MQGVYWKEIGIDRSEITKYSDCSERDGNVYVKIWYDGDDIDEEKTYSKSYLDELHREMEKKEKKRKKDEKKRDKKVEENHEKKHGWVYKILTSPFRLIWWIVKSVLSLLIPAFIWQLISGDEK